MVDTADKRLHDVVRGALPRADADTLAIVTACAGLLAGVAYADREFSDDEVGEVGRLLSTVEGIGPDGSRAIVQALKAHVLELSSVHTTRFARTLKELGHRDLRLHLLGMLLELAAADSEIKQAEVNTLRQLTGALGLTQDDYNRLQSEHRARLGTLR
jgi:uncharacterized tellurite resistance protein B-like protein